MKVEDEIVLVDASDTPIGGCAKLAAHQNGGLLHRAFSIFIFDRSGRMLLQRRSAGKYHFGGLWSNACCGHPSPTLDVNAAARKRLQEEFGFDAPLTRAFVFEYRASDPVSGLTEHEMDHVFIGQFDGQPAPNPDEIDDWRWAEPAELEADAKANPVRYTPWFLAALDRVLGAKPIH